MQDQIDTFDAIAAWLNGGGRPEGGPRKIVETLCRRLRAAGVPIERFALFIFTLHPNIAGRRIMWRPDSGVVVTEADHATMALPEIRESLAIHVARSGETVRSRLETVESPFRFTSEAELKAEGMSDLLVYPLIYTNGDRHAASFALRRPGGFTERDIAALMALQAPLARVTEAYVLRLNAAFLLSAYVGRNAGRRVLDGQVQRGDTEAIDAAVLFCDLKDFTAWSDTHQASEVVGRLNFFFDRIVPPIEANGGEVLKFLGDGLLAIFPVGPGGEAAATAAAVAAMTEAADSLSQHPEQGLAFRAALHCGEVNYGNIGGGARLDFTAIGRAVNFTARLLGVAASAGVDFVGSARVAAHLASARPLGQHALKGLAEPQPVYALAPSANR